MADDGADRRWQLRLFGAVWICLESAKIRSKCLETGLGFPWILSSETGLFNGLWGNLAKKNFGLPIGP